MSLRHILDWDDDDDRYGHAVERAATISIGLVVGIVVLIVVVLSISVIICICCVCKKRRASAGQVVRTGQPVAQVTTYSFAPSGPVQQSSQPYPMQYPASQPYQGYLPAQAYPAAGPPQTYSSASTGGWSKPPPGNMGPPPYSPQSTYGEHQKASAPPQEY